MSEFLQEKTLSPEKEKEVQTKIILEFMRHGKREKHPDKNLDGGPELRLTPEGRKQSDERGEKINPQAKVAMGLGSSRVRSQETAYRVMLVNEDIGPDDSLEEIEEKITHEQKVGKKMKEDDRLNVIDGGPISEAGLKAYHEKRYMPWVVNESDQSAIETGDKESSTYTRMAGNVAEIIQHYVKVGNNFNRIASKTDKYEEFGNQLERYPGTHQGVSESFAAKAIEKTQGMEKKKEFLEAVGSGFAEIEGIRIEIINRGLEQTILMKYKMNDSEESVELTVDLLNEIIKERKKFEEKIKLNDQQLL